MGFYHMVIASTTQRINLNSRGRKDNECRAIYLGEEGEIRHKQQQRLSCDYRAPIYFRS